MADNIDQVSGDWLKAGWDLPPYRSAEFDAMLQRHGITLAQFKKLAVYKYAVKRGLIVNDQWRGNR